MSLPASDAFNRADSGSLGSNWTEQINGLQIVSNEGRAVNDDLSYQYAFWNADSFGANHWSQFTMKTGIAQRGPVVRASGTGGSANGYSVHANAASTYFLKLANGTTSLLSGDLGVGWSDGDVIKLEAVGITLNIYKNGSLIGSITDASFATGSAGVMAGNDTAGFDDWSADNVAGRTTKNTRPRPLGRAAGISRGVNLS